MKAKLFIACFLCIAGMFTLFVAMFHSPEGEVSTSVLTAFGEVLTFAGAIFGVNYHFRK